MLRELRELREQGAGRAGGTTVSFFSLVFGFFCFLLFAFRLKELRGFPPCNFCCFIILDNLMDRART